MSTATTGEYGWRKEQRKGAHVDGKFQRSSSFRAACFLQQLILILWGVCSIISTFGWFVLVLVHFLLILG